MIQDAVMGRRHECIYASAGDPGAPIIYVTDAARAADIVLQAPKEKIKMVNYCVSGTPGAVSVHELETALKRRYPGTEIAYRSAASGLAITALKRFDDSYARKEWGWNPKYKLPEMTIDMLEMISKKLGIKYK